jgi:ubiquinone/menaquinone biosynthesis C-methylase UbiE
LKRLAQKTRGIPLLQFDLRHSPLPDHCLDAISCINVLEHIDDDRAALKEIYRILKPGGIAHIEVPAVPSCYDIYDEYLMHHRRYKMSELSKLVSDLHFQVLKKTHLGFFLFPAFYLIKRNNKKLFSHSPELKYEKIKKMMNQTNSSSLMKIVMKIETLLGRVISFPIGIRCVLVLRK